MAEARAIALVSDLTLEAGRLSGRVRSAPGARPPALAATGPDGWSAPLALLSLAEPGAHRFEIALPAALLADGLTLIAVVEAASGAVLARYPIVAGPLATEDPLAELALLAADLDHLRRAVLGHLADPPLTRAERPILLAETVAAAVAALAEARPGGSGRARPRPPRPLPPDPRPPSARRPAPARPGRR